MPEARILIGHGQMTGEQLEKAMLAFVRHEADILVATTIIETGLDIPNANTIFIHEADRYGLADLHQLRGRVGRFKHRAYAYMILEESKAVTPNAVRRLKAIEEFTDLGAGFKIAMRDLEIRGAGNILGTEQSGHIEAVGYELYCSLLESAVRSLTGKGRATPLRLLHRARLARLPAGRLRPLAQAQGRALPPRRPPPQPERLADFRQELIDRFGPLPAPADHLLDEAELRILAERWLITRIHTEDEFLVLTYRNPRRIEALADAHPAGLVRIVDDRTAYVPLGDDRSPAAARRPRPLSPLRTPIHHDRPIARLGTSDSEPDPRPPRPSPGGPQGACPSSTSRRPSRPAIPASGPPQPRPVSPGSASGGP